MIQLAELLGNVSEACRRSGIDRKTFYLWRRRFHAGGLAALRDARSVARPRADTKCQAAAGAVHRLALAHPEWGCTRLAGALAEQGVLLSSPSVQQVLRRHGLARRADRAFSLEHLAREGGLGLDREQVAAIERFDPAFRERTSPASRPGERLVLGLLHLASPGRGGRVHLRCVLDAHSALAFAVVHRGRSLVSALGLLAQRVLPFYRAHGLHPGAVWTPRSRAFCGRGPGGFPRGLARLGLEHRTWPAGHRDGLLERFRAQVSRELFGGAAGMHLDESLEGLQARLEEWLRAYNARPRPGYPSYGVPPLVLLEQALPAAAPAVVERKA